MFIKHILDAVQLFRGGGLTLHIATRRKSLGLTQEFVAQRLGVEIGTVSRIERGFMPFAKNPQQDCISIVRAKI
ncbi:helix-turn-helix transcriptional regulator [Methylobacillus caricis]|uniref:helix-turn-helix domain-containing protein n=1 Tax=Methylobacillus caricis TaxID=1971611 RepID=UPI001CFFE4DF|nr:helix-turn-helix transcriptional regulator [Methylobacillus caricis]MCB5187022.1 helix-turn-helix transcriptional regulator [Methylobacillus caricis]